MKQIAQGAQSVVYELQDGSILKQRLSKPYRHPQLDAKLIKERTKQQFNNLTKCQKQGIRACQVLKVVDNKLYLKRLGGPTLKKFFEDNPPQQKIIETYKEIARLVHSLHQANLIHGDLTSANFMFHQDSLHLIDFGLSYVKVQSEDKAVDLFVLEKALSSMHPHLEKFWKYLQDEYRNLDDKGVLLRLQRVRQRGRKRVAFG